MKYERTLRPNWIYYTPPKKKRYFTHKSIHLEKSVCVNYNHKLLYKKFLTIVGRVVSSNERICKIQLVEREDTILLKDVLLFVTRTSIVINATNDSFGFKSQGEPLNIFCWVQNLFLVNKISD